MVNKIKKLFKHRFISSAFWMFVATGILNVGNYVYHLLLIILISSPKIFGELESAIALLYILYVPLTTISLVIIKFISAAKGRGDYEAINNLYSYFNKVFIVGGIGLILLILLFSSLISSFLHFSSVLIAVLLALTFGTSLLSTIVRSTLQGLTNFFSLVIINLLEISSKLGLVVIFLLLGYQASGGLAAFVLSGLIGYAVGYYFIRRSSISFGKGSINAKPLFLYAIPVFFTTLAVTSFITSDIIIVRHFFPGVESGYYSFLSLLGKIIFFASTPVALVMFPLVSEHHAKGEKYTHFLYFSLGITILFIIPLVVVYYLFPNLIISFFPNKNYNIVASLFGPISIFFGVYSLNSLLLNFYLSIHKIVPTILSVTAAIVQILLLYFFHVSLYQIITISIGVSSVLLITLLLYYPYARR